ncbi:MAG TPA: serine/threonine-protein phosphatase, partial [Flavobacteriales bacterium]|nr:serine/threonine-protein phosphatase [Flavobacteriales bacterium]
ASGILRIYAEQENDTSSVMSSINKALCQSMEQDMNVTMIIAQFDHAKKQMTLANAGQHAYPLLIRNNSIEPVKAKGMALGMIPTIPYKPTTTDLESGDLLLFMTDGITEPRNADGVMYEESGRMNEVLANIPIEMPIEEVLDTIISDVEDYAADEEQDDDITLVAVRVA